MRLDFDYVGACYEMTGTDRYVSHHDAMERFVADIRLNARYDHDTIDFDVEPLFIRGVREATRNIASVVESAIDALPLEDALQVFRALNDPDDVIALIDVLNAATTRDDVAFMTYVSITCARNNDALNNIIDAYLMGKGVL